MATGEGGSGRVFKTLKDNGQWFDVVYGGGTIRWFPIDNPFPTAESNDLSGPQFDGPAGPSPESSPGMHIPTVRGGQAVHAIAELANSAANLLMWWEVRQQRLLEEATHEERRLVWLTDLIARWGEIHRAGGQLDFRVSEYLAREAREAMSALSSNKRVAIPQSILYELDLIQDNFRNFRTLLTLQFEEALQSEEIDLQNTVRRVLPGSKLDIDFIHTLGRDPAVEWAERVRAESHDSFDRSLADAFRHSDVFMARLFPSTELAVAESAPGDSGPSFVHRVVRLIANALPQPRQEPSKAETEKLDVFRELLLLPAEVSRVRALHAAWLATNAVVLEASGEEMGVRVGPTGLSVELVTSPRRLELNSRRPAAIEGA